MRRRRLHDSRPRAAMTLSTTLSTALSTTLSTALSTLTAAPQGVLGSCEHAGVLAERLADTDGDGKQELLLLRAASASQPAEMLRLALAPAAAALQSRGRIALADPGHTLVAIVDLLPRPGQEIVVTDPRGTVCLGWQTDDMPEPPPPVVLARSARFVVRVDQPQISPFVTDLNQDGRLDLMLPSLRGVEPFLSDGNTENGVPQFRRLAMVPVTVAVEVDPGSRGLDQELTGSLRIQQIQTEDLNGDGRPDLLTREGQVYEFHLQAEDGTFADPITVDIREFEDSTPKAAIELGSTVVLGDRQLLQRGDVDGDGIPDHVIAHRRKIWTFLSDRNGPQFTKARTQAVADDVTAMLVVDIDDDGRADLLTFRVQLAALGALLLALAKRRLKLSAVKDTMDATAKVTTMVMMLLIGSAAFSLVFRGLNGDIWIEDLLTSLPGGKIGLLLAANLSIFVLGFFIDFFEICFIIIPLIVPAARALGIDMIWFGVMIGMNLQTSFLTPPFGFALFYLRGVVPREVKTSDMYRGVIPFIIIQLIGLALVILFPGLVSE